MKYIFLTLVIAALVANCLAQQETDMAQGDNKYVSIEQASKAINVPVNLIKRAVRNGLAIPVKAAM